MVINISYYPVTTNIFSEKYAHWWEQFLSLIKNSINGYVWHMDSEFVRYYVDEKSHGFSEEYNEYRMINDVFGCNSDRLNLVARVKIQTKFPVGSVSADIVSTMLANSDISIRRDSPFAGFLDIEVAIEPGCKYALFTATPIPKNITDYQSIIVAKEERVCQVNLPDRPDIACSVVYGVNPT